MAVNLILKEEEMFNHILRFIGIMLSILIVIYLWNIEQYILVCLQIASLLIFHIFGGILNTLNPKYESKGFEQIWYISNEIERLFFHAVPILAIFKTFINIETIKKYAIYTNIAILIISLVYLVLYFNYLFLFLYLINLSSALYFYVGYIFVEEDRDNILDFYELDNFYIIFFSLSIPFLYYVFTYSRIIFYIFYYGWGKNKVSKA